MPRQIGNRVFVNRFYDGPMMVEVRRTARMATRWSGKGTSGSEIKTDGLHAIMCTPVVTETHLYGGWQLRSTAVP
jgi:hypothetical protein